MPEIARIEVEGAKELAALLRKIGDKDLQRQLRDAHRLTSTLVATRAQAKAPVRTGRLRASIRAGGTQTAAIIRAGGRRAPGAPAVHWGRKEGNVGSPPGNHRGRNVIEANPFLWNAGRESIGAASAVYESEVGKVFDQLGQLKRGGARGA